MTFLRGAYNKLKGIKQRNVKSRSIVLYLFFVLVSAVLWCIVTFNNTFTMDMEIPVKITSCPSNVHFLNHIPDTITVSVNSRGSSFVKYLFMSPPSLEINFMNHSDNGLFRIESAQLKRAINSMLNGTATVNTVLPNEIVARYTDLPGKRVPVVLDVDAHTAPMYTLSGNIQCDHDSVLVYGDKKTLNSINEIYSYHIKEVGLSDTLVRRVKLSSINGASIEPNVVQVTIPVEKMLSKKQKVQVSVRNVPDNVNVVVFPSTVEASFRAPMSYLKNNNGVITAVVDYNTINLNTPGNKVELLIGEVPGVYQDVKLSLDSVEYIIEKHR